MSSSSNNKGSYPYQAARRGSPIWNRGPKKKKYDEDDFEFVTNRPRGGFQSFRGYRGGFRPRPQGRYSEEESTEKSGESAKHNTDRGDKQRPTRPQDPRRCFNCLRFGHAVATCRVPALTCHNCGRKGHHFKACDQVQALSKGMQSWQRNFSGKPKGKFNQKKSDRSEGSSEETKQAPKKDSKKSFKTPEKKSEPKGGYEDLESWWKDKPESAVESSPDIPLFRTEKIKGGTKQEKGAKQVSQSKGPESKKVRLNLEKQTPKRKSSLKKDSESSKQSAINKEVNDFEKKKRILDSFEEPQYPEKFYNNLKHDIKSSAALNNKFLRQPDIEGVTVQERINADHFMQDEMMSVLTSDTYSPDVDKKIFHRDDGRQVYVKQNISVGQLNIDFTVNILKSVSPALAETFKSHRSLHMELDSTFRGIANQPEYKLSKNDLEIAEDLVQQYLNAGVIEERKDGDEVYGFTPVHIADNGEKARLVIDARTINSFFSPPAVELPRPCEPFRFMEEGVKFVKIDVSEAFMHVPLSEEFSRWFCFDLGGRKYRLKSMGFGWCNAPAIYQTIARALNERIRQTLPHLNDCQMIDDGLYFSKSLTESDVSVIISLYEELGLTVNTEKSVIIPSPEIEWMKFKYSNSGIKLSESGLAQYYKLKDSFRSLKTVGATLKLLGFLQWAVQTFRFLLPTLSNIQQDFPVNLRVNKSLHQNRSPDALQDRIIHLLDQFERVCDRTIDPRPKGNTFYAYTDASLNYLGFYSEGRSIQEQIKRSEGDEIGRYETLAILRAVENLQHSNCSLIIYTDSANAHYSLRKGASHSRANSDLITRILEKCFYNNISLITVKISSNDNLADKPSRKSLPADELIQWNDFYKVSDKVSLKVGQVLDYLYPKPILREQSALTLLSSLIGAATSSVYTLRKYAPEIAKNPRMFEGYTGCVLGAAVLRLLSTVNQFSDLTISRKREGKFKLPGKESSYDDNSLRCITHKLLDLKIISHEDVKRAIQSKRRGFCITGMISKVLRQKIPDVIIEESLGSYEGAQTSKTKFTFLSQINLPISVDRKLVKKKLRNQAAKDKKPSNDHMDPDGDHRMSQDPWVGGVGAHSGVAQKVSGSGMTMSQFKAALQEKEKAIAEFKLLYAKAVEDRDKAIRERDDALQNDLISYGGNQSVDIEQVERRAEEWEQKAIQLESEVKALMLEAQKHKSNADKLNISYEAAATHISSLDQEIISYKQTISSLKINDQKSKQEVRKLQDSLDNSGNEIIDLKAKIRSQETQIEDLERKNQRSAQIQSDFNQVSKERDQAAEKVMEMNKLKDICEHLSSLLKKPVMQDLRQWELSLCDAVGALNLLSQKYDGTVSLLKSSQDEIKKLLGQISQNDIELRKLNLNSSKQEIELKNLRSQIGLLEASAKERDQQIEKRTLEYNILEQRYNQEVTEKVMGLSTSLKAHKEESVKHIAALTQERERLNTEVGDLQLKLLQQEKGLDEEQRNKFLAELSQVQEKVKVAEKKYNDYRESTQNRIIEQESRISQLSSDAAIKEQQLEQLGTELAKQKSFFEQSKARNTSLKERLVNTTLDKDKSLQEIESLRSEARTAVEKCKGLEKSILDLQSSVEQVTKTRDDLRRDNDSLILKIKSLQPKSAECAALSAEKTKLLAKLDKRNGEIAELKGQVFYFEKKTGDFEQDSQTSRDKIKNLNDKILRLSSDLSKKSDECESLSLELRIQSALIDQVGKREDLLRKHSFNLQSIWSEDQPKIDNLVRELKDEFSTAHQGLKKEIEEKSKVADSVFRLQSEYSVIAEYAERFYKENLDLKKEADFNRSELVKLTVKAEKAEKKKDRTLGTIKDLGAAFDQTRQAYANAIAYTLNRFEELPHDYLVDFKNMYEHSANTLHNLKVLEFEKASYFFNGFNQACAIKKEAEEKQIAVRDLMAQKVIVKQEIDGSQLIGNPEMAQQVANLFCNNESSESSNHLSVDNSGSSQDQVS